MLQDGSVQPLSPALRDKANEVVNHMAEKALRCLAFAQKTDDLGALLLCTQSCRLTPLLFWLAPGIYL